MSVHPSWRFAWWAALLPCCGGTDLSAPNAVPQTAGSARVRRLTPEEVAEAPYTAWGRAGDLILQNDLAAFVISAGYGSNGYLGEPGGLVDVHVVEDGERLPFEGLDELWPLINGAPVRADAIAISRVDDDTLEVRFSGPQRAVPRMFALAGAEPELRALLGSVAYRLSSDSASLEIEISAQNVGDAALRVELGDFAMYGTDAAEMFTFPAGFDHSSDLTRVDAIGSAADAAPWAALAFATEPLELIRGWTVRDLLEGGQTGVIRYDVGVRELAPGEEMSTTHWLAVGRDAAELRAEYHRQRSEPTTTISGQVSAAGQPVPWARVCFFEDADATRLVARARASEDGRFAAWLPSGTYFARASGRAHGEHAAGPDGAADVAEGFSEDGGSARRVEVGDASVTDVDLTLAPAAALRIAVRDASGSAAAAKLTVVYETAAPAVSFIAGERAPYAELGVAQVHWSLSGEARVALAAGTYTIFASRGPLPPLAVARGVVVGAGGAALDLVLPDRVGPPGYFAMDSHLHGADSGHGEVTRAERLITARAEGLDVAVSTDHDRIVDYAPVAAELGIDTELLTIASAELTHSPGHHNPWPLALDASRPNGGSPRWWLDDPGLDALYADYEALGAEILQVNHSAGYFASGYDPSSGQGRSGPGFNMRFNAMELHNAKGSGGRGGLLPIWFSLLGWGHRIAPLAASDSHARIPEAGTGRTYVWLGAGAPLTERAVTDAVLALATVASTGPLATLLLEDGSPGLGRDVTPGADGAVRFTIQVWAPDWMPIERVSLLANGSVAELWDRSSAPAVSASVGADGLWFEHRVTLSPEVDTWYAVEASGDADLAPIYPNLTPWAITAPLFVDADGESGFTPPCAVGACP